MAENAHSALLYYGRQLAGEAVTVPLGMSPQGWRDRDYTSDNSQPVAEHFIHAVAALAATRHLLAENSSPAGLYAMGAAARDHLAGETAMPGGTLADLARMARTQAQLLEVWSRILRSGRVGARPLLAEAVSRLEQPVEVADALDRQTDVLKNQLKWLREVVGIDMSPLNTDAYTRELNIAARLRRRPLREREGAALDGVDRGAYALVRWTGAWLRDTEGRRARERAADTGRHAETAHWPEPVKTEGLQFELGRPGDLREIPRADVAPVLGKFVDARFVSENGWPHPLAAADHFRYAIERHDPLAQRQLEILLTGVAAGHLKVEGVAAPHPGANKEGDTATLDRWVALVRSRTADGDLQELRSFPGVGSCRLVYHSDDTGEVVLGITAPHTLLCPTPFVAGDVRSRAWASLWKDLHVGQPASQVPWSFQDGVVRQEPWGEKAEPFIQVVVAWAAHLRGRHGDLTPRWIELFPGRGVPRSAPYGPAGLCRAYWNRDLVDVQLPVRGRGKDDHGPRKEMDWSDLVSRVPDLESFGQYSRIDLEIPWETDPVPAWWEGHLQQLKEDGQIDQYLESGGLEVWLYDEDELCRARLPKARILNRKTVAISRVEPLREQGVLDPSEDRGHLRFPDLPIRAEYLDVVAVGEGGELVRDLVKRGETLEPRHWSPDVLDEGAGKVTLKWSIDVRGRGEPLKVVIPGVDTNQPTQAHWMVWPGFRTPPSTPWKAYYIYKWCSRNTRNANVLWLDESVEGGKLRIRTSQDMKQGQGRKFGTFPLKFDRPRGGGQSTGPVDRVHSGGPPVAFEYLSTSDNRPQGLYLVPLTPLPAREAAVDVAIDFGTSHSVAAFKVRQPRARAEQVPLFPELDPQSHRTNRPLTLHVCQSRPHVFHNTDGIIQRGTWMPTYLARGEGVLPSELLTDRPVQKMNSSAVETWIPGGDYQIPPLQIRRRDMSLYLVADFKWGASVDLYGGKETGLQRLYLEMLLQLVLATVVLNPPLEGVPRRVRLTFTYPLRSSEHQVNQFGGLLETLIADARRSLGLDIQLMPPRTMVKADGSRDPDAAAEAGPMGLYDESRAARLDCKATGEVCLVADLGGGTLDVFLSAKGRTRAQKLEELADSVRIGGNVLLREMAENRNDYLPDSPEWRRGESTDTYNKLRSWIRTMGARSLFGTNAHGVTHEILGLEGFASSTDSEPARKLIASYFQLVIDYLARCLVTYLAVYWYQTPPALSGEHVKLMISVQLRGNGWRLNLKDESHEKRTEWIQEAVRARAEELWAKHLGHLPKKPFPGGPNYWGEVKRYLPKNPKLDPIRRVVGDPPLARREVAELWFSFLLLDVLLNEPNSPTERRLRWTERLPVSIPGFDANHELQLPALSPKIQLAGQSEVDQLDADEMDIVDEALVHPEIEHEGKDRKLKIAVAPAVWEVVLTSLLGHRAN